MGEHGRLQGHMMKLHCYYRCILAIKLPNPRRIWSGTLINLETTVVFVQLLDVQKNYSIWLHCACIFVKFYLWNHFQCLQASLLCNQTPKLQQKFSIFAWECHVNRTLKAGAFKMKTMDGKNPHYEHIVPPLWSLSLLNNFNQAQLCHIYFRAV